MKKVLKRNMRLTPSTARDNARLDSTPEMQKTVRLVRILLVVHLSIIRTTSSESYNHRVYRLCDSVLEIVDK